MAYDVARLKMEVDSTGLVRGERDLQRFGATAKKTSGTVATATKTLRGLAGAMAAVGAGAAAMAALNRAAAQAGQFGTALAEVSTLVEGTPQQMAKLRSEATRLSNTFGGSATRNAKAFYQAISAGAATVEDASKIVEQANKLAVGGLTDVFVATDGLTSVMNAYAESGLTAAQASDSMFVAVKAGKTTIDELASALGRIAPFASAAGVSFDELNAAIAAVTAKGINTNEAVTGLRQALVSITKPSAQAVELAGELGLQFNSAALEAKGLEGFMGDLARATGGSVAQLTELLGSAEAANATLALLAGGGEKFSATLADMVTKAGATDAAVAKMADTFENRMARAMATIENAGMGPGQLWLNLKVNVAEAAADIITDIQRLADTAKKIFSGDWKAAWEGAAKDVDIATSGMNVATLGALENIKALVSKENLDAVKGFFGALWDGITGGGNSGTEAARMAPDFNIVRDEYLRMMEDMRLATNDMYANWDEATRAAAIVTEEELGGAAERAKIEFVQIGEVAGGQAWGGIKKAAEAAGELADNLREASTYADGTAAGTGNAGDGYSGVKGGGGLSSLGGRTQTIYTRPIIEDQLENGLFAVIGRFNDALRESIVDGVEKGFDDVKDLDFGNDVLTMSVEPGATDAFWAEFEFKATNSWTSALTAAFDAGGDSLLAITDDMVGALKTGLDEFSIDATKQMFHVNTGFGALDSWLNNSIDNQLTEMIQTNLEVIGRGFNGIIQGSKTQVREFAKILKTIEIERLDGEITTKVQKITKTKNNRPLDRLLTSISKDIINSVDVYADALGVTAKDFSKISHRFQFSFKDGTSPKDIEKMFQAEIEEYSEKLAKAALKGNNAFRNAGETWINAMERMATDFWGIYNSLKLLDGQMFKNNLRGANFASKLVDLFGTPEEFNDLANQFFAAFYTPEEQTSSLKKYAKGVFRDVGLDPKDLPKTREELADLLKSFDLEDSMGRERYAAILGLTGVFDAILPAFGDAEEAGNGAAEALAAYNAAMSDVGSTLRGMISTAISAGREFAVLSGTLADTANSVRNLGRSDAQSLDVLRAQFGGLYNRSLGGDVDAMRDISGVATAYANAFKGQAASAAEYQFFTAGLASKLDELSGVAASEAAMSEYEAESLQALLDAVQNGELTNQLMLDTIAALGTLDDSLLAGLRAIYEYNTGETPGFASGGNHTGGYRIVGERGPELEATGPSRIHSNAQTRALLGIDDLRKDMAKMHAENRSLNIKIEKHGRKVEQLLTKFDTVGLPPERAA